MKFSYFLFFALLCFITTTNAQQVGRKGVTPINKGTRSNTKPADFNVDQLKGKWQEYKRTGHDGNEVSFTDSALLNFTDSSKVETKTSVSNSMSMTGTATIDGNNVLTAAADVYTIKKVDKNEMLLDDDDYLHYFKRVDTFYYQLLGKNIMKQDNYDSSITTSISNILGKWSVYKRQAKPGAITSDMQLIKYLNITVKTNDNTASGDVTFYQGQASQQLPCTVSVDGSNIKIVAGQNKWDLSIFQADANNFIFGNSSLLYFSKKDN